MNREKLMENLEIMFNQIGGPINISSYIEELTGITNDLVNYLRDKGFNIENYSITDLYSLYCILKIILEYLGEDEFNTVTGLDLYNDGYKTLNYVKHILLGKYE